MRKLLSLTPALCVLIAALVALLVAPEIVQRVNSASTQARVTLVRQAASNDDILERLDRATRNLAKIVEPSVVHLDVVEAPAGHHGLGMSSGSGWIFDDHGNIVTNHHVVNGAANLAVQFSDGRRASARVVGSDPYTDVAVIHVDEDQGLLPAARATGIHPEKGQRVYAFGSPFGYKFSMTEGVISGLGRTARAGIDLQFSNFIQHDAAMNPGNSGGPLVDIQGRVVGMNVAIATAKDSQGSTNPDEVGQSAGVSFAIPLATIESVVKQLIGAGKVQRGFLGISFRSGGDAIMENGRFKGRGVLVGSVEKGFPADQAGLKRGDIITQINEDRVADGDVLRAMISSTPPGTELTLKVWREEHELAVPLTLGQMPETVLERPRLAMLSNLREALGLEIEKKGTDVVVTDVASGSLAEKFGLKPQQVLKAVAGKAIETPDAFAALLLQEGLLRGREVEVTVDESGESKTLKFSIKE